MNGSNLSKSASVAERDALLADHRWMDGELERLTSAFKADDLSNIQAVWSGLEPFLLAHMESEEDLL